MNPAEVVGHRIGHVVAHAQGAGIVVRGAQIVTIFEVGQRGQTFCTGAGCDRYSAVAGKTFASNNTAASQNVEGFVACKNQRDLVGNGIHLVPCRTVVIRLGTAGKLLRRGVGVAQVNNRLGTIKIGLQC